MTTLREIDGGEAVESFCTDSEAGERKQRQESTKLLSIPILTIRQKNRGFSMERKEALGTGA